MEKISFVLNGKSKDLVVDPDMKLLWLIRDVLGLTGTKYSCGKSLCGSCTVIIDGRARKSCAIKAKNINGSTITTIEGLSQQSDHPIQQAWLDEDVSQCGYCQPGQIMTAVELLNNVQNPTDEDIDRHMSKVLCRCGTYNRIRKAIHKASGVM
jgi:isoquinoline 1-oxidoreductase alpha subunit